MTVEPAVDLRTGVSIRARAVSYAARLMLRPVLTLWPLTSWGMRPLPLIDIAARLLPTPRRTDFERVSFDGYVGEWARADGAAPDGAVVYFHGGAFVTCGVATHRHEVAAISAACGLPVLSVAYRQLPQVPLVGSVADCLAVYRSLLDDGYEPNRIVFAGDSAGGHLAFATALAALRDDLPVPAGIVALSPWLDLDPATKLAHPNAARDAYAPAGRLTQLARLMSGDGADPHPSMSPVNQDLRGLPPVLLIASASEMLRPDAELMAERLGAADVPCTLQLWEGQIHAFPVLGELVPESMRAIREVGVFARRVTSRLRGTGRGRLSALAG